MVKSERTRHNSFIGHNETSMFYRVKPERNGKQIQLKHDIQHQPKPSTPMFNDACVKFSFLRD